MSGNVNPDAPGSGIGHISASYRNPLNQGNKNTQTVTPFQQGATGDNGALSSGTYSIPDNVIIGGIHTRYLIDAGLVLTALVLFVIGILLMSKTDIMSAIKQVAKVAPIVGE